MKRAGILFFVVVAMVLSSVAPSVPRALAASIYPPNGTLASKTIQSLAMPAELQTVTDPTFGNQVQRVSDQATFGTTAQYLRNDYAKIQTWNADDSLAFLIDWAGFNKGFVIDGRSGQYLRSVTVPIGNHTARWSNVNPNNMYGIPQGGGCDNGNQMGVWHPETDPSSEPTVTLLHTFSQFDTCAQMTFGLDQGNLSNDDSVGAVIGWSTAHNSWGIVSFSMSNLMTDTPTVTEIATTWLGAAGGPGPDPDHASWNNITTMPKGDGILVQWNASGPGINQGIEWYSKNLSSTLHVTNTSDHFDTALDIHNNEVVVASCSQPGDNTANTCTGVTQPALGAHIVLYGMGAAGPTGSNLVVQPFVRGLADGTHHSCRNFKRPGWCYVSDMMNNAAQPVGYEQIYAIKLDGSQTVEVFGVDHGAQNTCASCNADAAMAVPTQDGSRVMFGSEWGGGTTAPVYEYMAQWPLQNGSFENTGSSWLSPWFINSSISDSSTTQDGSTFVDGTHSANNYMPTAGANDSAYRLIQTGLNIVNGQTYTIIFWLKADVARTVRARLGQSVSPGSPYGADPVDVTTAWQKFTWTFTSPVTDSNAQFSFNMGNAAGHVWVDAVSIQ